MNGVLRLKSLIMPLFLRCSLTMLMTTAAFAATGCHKAKTGSTDVVVIGDRPKLVDPFAGPPTPADSLLLANVAQGLIRFDARGQIDSGLAERWNVSDDGLSYIFRVQSARWPSGREIDAREIARILNRERRTSSGNALKDTIGAIDEIVAMTDRVIEIRLKTPRPNLLQLLAQPEFAILHGGEGSGPFSLLPGRPEEPLHLRRIVPGPDGDQDAREDIDLSGLPAPSAIARFRSGEADLVVGGTFADLPVVRGGGGSLPRGALRFDPVAGLFALVPGRADGPLADQALRSLIARAIDRDALVAAFDVDGLAPRTTVLQPGLDGLPDPVVPGWAAVTVGQRRAGLVAEADRMFGGKPEPALTVSFPAGPGATLMLNRLAADLAPLGIHLTPADDGVAADLRLLDEVAPSTSPAWFVRRFRCDRVPICDPAIDALSDAARATPSPQQRAQFLALAAQRIDADQLIIPLTAPIRWSLVSANAPGFAENRFARHTLSGLAIKPTRDRD